MRKQTNSASSVQNRFTQSIIMNQENSNYAAFNNTRQHQIIIENRVYGEP